jgi:hypothetical protein
MQTKGRPSNPFRRQAPFALAPARNGAFMDLSQLIRKEVKMGVFDLNQKN